MAVSRAPPRHSGYNSDRIKTKIMRPGRKKYRRAMNDALFGHKVASSDDEVDWEDVYSLSVPSAFEALMHVPELSEIFVQKGGRYWADLEDKLSLNDASGLPTSEEYISRAKRAKLRRYINAPIVSDIDSIFRSFISSMIMNEEKEKEKKHPTPPQGPPSTVILPNHQHELPQQHSDSAGGPIASIGEKQMVLTIFLPFHRLIAHACAEYYQLQSKSVAIDPQSMSNSNSNYRPNSVCKKVWIGWKEGKTTLRPLTLSAYLHHAPSNTADADDDDEYLSASSPAIKNSRLGRAKSHPKAKFRMETPALIVDSDEDVEV